MKVVETHTNIHAQGTILDTNTLIIFQKQNIEADVLGLGFISHTSLSHTSATSDGSGYHLLL